MGSQRGPRVDPSITPGGSLPDLGLMLALSLPTKDKGRGWSLVGRMLWPCCLGRVPSPPTVLGTPGGRRSGCRLCAGLCVLFGRSCLPRQGCGGAAGAGRPAPGTQPGCAQPCRGESSRGAGATALEVRNRPHGAGSSGHGAGRGGHGLPPGPPRRCRRCSGRGLFKKAAPPLLCPSRRRCREAPAGDTAGTGRPETGWGSGSLGAGAGPRRY